jgi:hypothetical protein
MFRRTPTGILRVFTRPVLHKPMFSDDLAWGNFLLFGRYYQGAGPQRCPTFDDGQPVTDDVLEPVRALGDEIAVPVRWQKGDLVVLDNTRFMHGRTAVVDADERQIASFFGYLKFAIPDTEEVHDAPWRRAPFVPPRTLRDAKAARSRS